MAALAAGEVKDTATAGEDKRMELSPEVSEKFNFITRDLQEWTDEGELVKILQSDKPLKLYWGTATTGRPHVGYLVPMMKIADFLRAGCAVTVLFADLHAYLDNLKSTWELLEFRTQYYEQVIRKLLQVVGAPIDKLNFVRGTSYQLSREYTLDVYRLSAIMSLHDATKGGAEVVKQVASPLLSSLLYPGLQALDEEYLHVDAQFGGNDQRKIFMLAQKYLPKLGYKKRIHLMNPMVAGFSKPEEGKDKAKMSSSDPNSKIDLIDSAKAVKSKIKKAWAPPGVVEGNGLLAFCKHVLFKFLQPEPLQIKRREENGGDVAFSNYEDLEQAYAAGDLHPGDLKNSVTKILNDVLEPIRSHFSSPEMQQLIRNAYPPTDEAAAETKKQKNKRKQKQKQKGKKGGQSSPQAPDFCRVDFRVGRVVSVEHVEGSDKLFKEQIDLGEESPRQIVSGLRPYMSAEDFTGKLVVVIANLKAQKMAGIPSNGMVLCAMKEGKCELLAPPEGSQPGDIVSCPALAAPTPDGTIKIYSGSKQNKWDPWTKCKSQLRTADAADDSGTVPVQFDGTSLVVSRTGQTLCVASLTTAEVS